MHHWDGIEAFVHVVQRGSFKDAAIAMNVSPSHVSRKVSELEKKLGMTLIHRTTRSIRLSELGEQYFRECSNTLEKFNYAEELLRKRKEDLSGALKISCAITFGERFIVPALAEFAKLYPKIQIDLELSNNLVDLVKDEYDLAIRVGKLENSSLIARRLCERREYVCATPEYIKLHGCPENLNDLAEHNCLLISHSMWVFQENGARRDIRVKGDWNSNSGPATLEATKAGIGISQLPDYYVEPLIRQNKLVSLLEEYCYPHSGVWLVYPGGRSQLARLKLLCEHLVSFVKNRTW